MYYEAMSRSSKHSSKPTEATGTAASAATDDVASVATESLANRLTELERKVADLESRSSETDADGSENTGSKASEPASRPRFSGGTDDDTFWVLNGLVDRFGPDGGVVYAGHVTPPGAQGPVAWQMGLTGEVFDDLNFAEAASSLAALGHPVRLELLRAIYDGVSTVAELSTDDRFGTTGQIYHHVHALAGAGWLENSQRGHWRIPAAKVIPLLTLMLIGTH